MNYYRDKNACYIGILGAHPDALGKKVGKTLVLKSIEKATKEGNYERLDLNISYRLADGIQLNFKAQNLTDEPRIDYRAVYGNTLQALSYGPRYFLGIKGKF